MGEGEGVAIFLKNTSIAHFGLGNQKVIDSAIVKWTGKTQQVLTNQNANQLLFIEQQEGKNNSLVMLGGAAAFLLLISSAIFLLKNRYYNN